MREIRVIVHPKLCPQAPEELHRGHLGGMKIKALQRTYIWWPGIHKEIEEAARTCSGWQLTEAEPSAGAIHLREWPSAPWQRIHVDFAGPFLGCMFLIGMDAYSRRLQIGKKRTPRPQRKPLRNCRLYSLDMVCHPSKLVTMGHSLYLRTFRSSSEVLLTVSAKYAFSITQKNSLSPKTFLGPSLFCCAVFTLLTLILVF